MKYENQILIGDALAQLRRLPAGAVNCCVTSPPYWGLRDYGVKGQIGLEKTPEDFVEHIVEVFREVRRVLRDDGTLWLNLGDSYSGSGKGPAGNKGATHNARHIEHKTGRIVPKGLKPKDLVGIPWRVAFALQADGWYLRSDIIWSKPNAMPESVTDRPTKAHEYVFLMSKSPKYFYDSKAIAEPIIYGDHPRNGCPGPDVKAPGQVKQAGITRRRRSGNKERVFGAGRARPRSHLGASIPWEDRDGKKNRRTVWEIATHPYPEAHFATFPEELVNPCILAGCPEGGLVLDPFMGAGTVALVALKASRQFVGIELNPKFVKMARERISSELNQGRLL